MKLRKRGGITYVGLLICGLKCTLVASQAAPGESWWHRDRQTDRCQNVTLCFLVSVGHGQLNKVM